MKQTYDQLLYRLEDINPELDASYTIKHMLVSEVFKCEFGNDFLKWNHIASKEAIDEVEQLENERVINMSNEKYIDDVRVYNDTGEWCCLFGEYIESRPNDTEEQFCDFCDDNNLYPQG